MLEAAAYGDLAVGQVEDFLSICHLGQAELLGDLGAYLGGIAVDGLAAAEDDVVVADFTDGLGQGV